MRKFLGLVLSALVISGCGGGGDSGEPVPTGTVSGTTFDGLISEGDVKVYDFSTGRKGALLASATTNELGLYSLSLQAESGPVWVELTGGNYTEEADLNNVILQPGHKLVAVANYKTGTSLTVAVTTYSYLAAGLAQHQIKQGTAVAAAIDSANSRISKLVGLNILNTIPKQITDVANQSASLTPALRYGFLAGAISQWTLDHAPASTIQRKAPYNSIDFAQLMYQDILADGLLDGFGIDDSGAKTQLSFGTTPLGVDVYRLGLGTAIVQMGLNANNKTGLPAANLMPFATEYLNADDAVFNNVPPVPMSPGTVVPLNFSKGTNNGAALYAGMQFSAQSQLGVTKVELIVDNNVVVSISDLAGEAKTQFHVEESPYNKVTISEDKKTFGVQFSTTSFSDPHSQYSMVVRLTNGLGQQVLSTPTEMNFYGS